MKQYRIASYEPAWLPAIVAFWNRTFADRRNFFSIDAALFETRVTQVQTAIEHFEPEGLRLAVENEQVIGMIHGGHRSAAAAAALNPGWPGGPQAYVALIAVDPEHRRAGVGGALLRSVLGYLQSPHRVVLDGQCISAYYGNALAPFQPLWGTTEGISIDWEDTASRGFFEQQGFHVRHQAVSLELELAQAQIRPRTELSTGHSMTHCLSHCPALGGYPEDGVEYQTGHRFWTHAYLIDGKVAGTLVSYPMAQLAEPKWAIYELKVQEKRRGQGVGGRLQAALIRDLQRDEVARLEVLTIPKLSPGARELYEKFGFRTIASWAIY